LDPLEDCAADMAAPVKSSFLLEGRRTEGVEIPSAELAFK
jgi:hypothetical protein